METAPSVQYLSSLESQENLGDQNSNAFPDEFSYNTSNFHWIYHSEFAMLLHPEIIDLCSMCKQLITLHSQKPQEICLNSGGFYRFAMECTRSEDLLDQVHAEQQKGWDYIRKLLAIIKHSCAIVSNLQELSQHTEKLTEAVEGNFAMANQFVLRHFYRLLLESAQNLLNELLHLNVIQRDTKFNQNFQKYFIPDIKPILRLRSDKQTTGTPGQGSKGDTRESILYLASTLLEDCYLIEYLGHLQNSRTSQRSEIICRDLHEETLSAQRETFHSIITWFDTQCSQKQLIADSQTQELIRHVKIIYWLLDAFSMLMRITERHYSFFSSRQIPFALSENEVQEIIFDFFLTYIERFRLQIEKISRQLIQKYSISQKIDLPIPCYRGFHVRPSTLVARIVIHYGSKVSMLLNDLSYNAAVPLDLFRANEVINAEKRRQIGKIVANDPSCQHYSKQLRTNYEPILVQKYFLELFRSLQNRKKIVTYESLSIEALERPLPEEEFFEYAKRQVAYLVATGKIDMTLDLMVTFEGDSRVLSDIRILAQNGYGEDKQGNNIPLPKELSYLRR